VRATADEALYRPGDPVDPNLVELEVLGPGARGLVWALGREPHEDGPVSPGRAGVVQARKV
jgi:hypothetical protein